MNKLGDFLWQGLDFLWGGGLYAAPPILLLIIVWLIFRRGIKHAGWRISGAALFLLVFSAMCELFVWRGGALGGFTANILKHYFGVIGAYFCLLILLWMSVLLMLNCTVKNFVFFLYKTFVSESAPPKHPTPSRAPGPQRIAPLPPRAPQTPPSARQQVVPPKPAVRQTRAAAVVFKPTTPRYISRAGNYKFPPLKLLRPPVDPRETQRRQAAQFYQDKQLLENTLASFNVKAAVTNVCQGPSVTRYELTPGHGVRVNKIASLADDISLNMAAAVRIEAPVPGKSVVGIEVPNQVSRPVNLSELAGQPEFSRHPLTTALGLDIAGSPVFCALPDMPHLLIAGATGSGKSVCVNSLIMSILLKSAPQDVRFVMIDPKKVELSVYNDLPHLVAPVVDDAQMAQIVLKHWALPEMESRYEEFKKVGARNIEDFNRRPGKHLPFVVIIIDELADLMLVASKTVEESINRLAAKGRAAGLHLVIATQRPSVDVITGLIKANVPSRVAFAVKSQIDSRTIIDGMGAEKLLGKGDMLYSPLGARQIRRVQGVFVSDEEINQVTHFIRAQSPPAYELDLGKLRAQAEQSEDESKTAAAGSGGPNVRNDGKDVLFDQAAQLVQSTGKKSISYIQRKFRIGYNRAARLVEELEAAGILSGL
ncbi:MAG: DNA translocase FtsK 4TM domain-containing protein [Candidatus Margulisbacteria bacterium]|jgi:S-DNA-T family DNA segregation ATPase FtsK/SpoIIIE|nr:DNA translocase FtsK 4TM domain-containing protein [Candidatus Margulisiibacteriota bacterium]